MLSLAQISPSLFGVLNCLPFHIYPIHSPLLMGGGPNHHHLLENLNPPQWSSRKTRSLSLSDFIIVVWFSSRTPFSNEWNWEIHNFWQPLTKLLVSKYLFIIISVFYLSKSWTLIIVHSQSSSSSYCNQSFWSLKHL